MSLNLSLDLFVLHEVKRASEASEASRSELVEISHGLQLWITSPTHICKKKNFYPFRAQGSFVNVCPSFRPSVGPSVRPSVSAKKCFNFLTGQRKGLKFSGTPQLIGSNFWAGDPDPWAFRYGPGPGKGPFLPNLSPPWVLK